MIESGKNAANKRNPSLSCFIYDCLLSSCCDVAACCIILWEIWRQCLWKVLEERLSSAERPYTIAIYSDEVSPGNQLKHTNVLYWSLQELGPLRLSNESSCFVLAVVRTETVNESGGGMSQVARECVNALPQPWRRDPDGRRTSSVSRCRLLCRYYDFKTLRDGGSCGVHFRRWISPPRHFWENTGASGKFCCLAKMCYNDDMHLSPWLGWCILTGATPTHIIKGSLVGKLPKRRRFVFQEVWVWGVRRPDLLRRYDWMSRAYSQ